MGHSHPNLNWESVEEIIPYNLETGEVILDDFEIGWIV